MTKFKLNKRGMSEFMCSDQVGDEMKRRGELVRARAIQLSPVSRNNQRAAAHKGAYRNSFAPVTTKIGRDDLTKWRAFGTGKRVYAQVSNTSDHAYFVEQGVVAKVTDENGEKKPQTDDQGNAVYRTPRYRVLGRALDAARG